MRVCGESDFTVADSEVHLKSHGFTYVHRFTYESSICVILQSFNVEADNLILEIAETCQPGRPGGATPCPVASVSEQMRNCPPSLASPLRTFFPGRVFVVFFLSSFVPLFRFSFIFRLSSVFLSAGRPTEGSQQRCCDTSWKVESVQSLESLESLNILLQHGRNLMKILESTMQPPASQLKALRLYRLYPVLRLPMANFQENVALVETVSASTTPSGHTLPRPVKIWSFGSASGTLPAHRTKTHPTLRNGQRW